MQKKYLFITGGVVSSLGKGITAASIAVLLEKMGLSVSMLKLDPYLNVDPGTMSPYQHGEVYVTDDGAETDLDLGHYFRFTRSPLSKASNATSGQIYDSVIRRERKGDYLGNTVQVIPHITDEIKRRIVKCAEQKEETQVVIVEIGGTVGDIESLPFLEAIRQFENENRGSCLNLHLTYVPYLKAAGEVKTKPTQHSVQVLRGIGLLPDIILCRCDEPLDSDIKDKISLFCNVSKEAVIDEPDVAHTIYEVPMQLAKQNLHSFICERLNLPFKEPELSRWHKLVDVIKKPEGEVTIGIIGKYVQHQDAYKSVFEALEHGAIHHNFKVNIKRIEADKLSLTPKGIEKALEGCDGCLVPGGFGERGFGGKVLTAKYCREKKIPFFGICLGMHVLVTEFAQNVAHLKGASSTEIEPDTPHPVISLLSEQKNVTNMGGTMRLGSYPCTLDKNSKTYQAYQKEVIDERHRHRYEFNNAYKESFENLGLLFSGILKDGQLCEIAEVKDHPWMVGVQFHPEFKSKPTEAHPLFSAFVEAGIKHQKGQL